MNSMGQGDVRQPATMTLPLRSEEGPSVDWNPHQLGWWAGNTCNRVAVQEREPSPRRPARWWVWHRLNVLEPLSFGAAFVIVEDTGIRKHETGHHARRRLPCKALEALGETPGLSPWNRPEVIWKCRGNRPAHIGVEPSSWPKIGQTTCALGLWPCRDRPAISGGSWRSAHVIRRRAA